jgi:tryptophan synthase alpha chain
MKRLNNLFSVKKKNILSIYFTAGYPALDDTSKIIRALETSGADILEIGMPYSDPMADGITIQNSNSVALQNGMSTRILFQQLAQVRNETTLPIILMGYVNSILAYGIDAFCADAENCGVDALIIPDLPLIEYKKHEQVFSDNDLGICFLITAQTSEERIREIDELSPAFIYLVTSAGVTGRQLDFSEAQIHFLKRISSMNLKTPILAGFGLSNRQAFLETCKYVNGAIIGSSFIKALPKDSVGIEESVKNFIHSILYDNTIR